MKLLILEAIISVVYIFDVSTYPIIHVSFYFLTMLYFVSMMEMYGFVRLVKFVSKRLARREGHRGVAKVFISALSTSSPTLP